MLTRDRIIEVYGAQLGELAWHALHADSRLNAVSEQHAASILRAVSQCRGRRSGQPVRILEIGAYAHFGAHSAAAALGGESVAHDVSPASLRLGLEGARRAGIGARPTLVAGDFHDLPFSTGYFDIAFCASSIHHTFRPWRVLQEALRVLRPGGVLLLENEPIGRALSFYGFRGNRAEDSTPFEAELARRGSLFTFSSPFPGTRPEMLFGMIENERIPLDMVVGALTAAGDIVSLELKPQLGEFERRILALRCDADLEAGLAALLLDEVRAVRPGLTERDRLLGARLPDEDAIWRLSYQVAPGLRRLKGLSGTAAEYETARLFGAALKATTVKHGRGAASPGMFRRDLPLRNGVYDDLPVLPGVRLHLAAQPLPAIEAGDLAALAEVYPAADWEPYREENGLHSMLNLGPRCRIVLPGLASMAMLLLRFYAVSTSQPYRVSLRSQDGADIAAPLVVRSESLLLRELIDAGVTAVFIETRTLDGEPLDLPRHVRIGVGRLIPVTLQRPEALVET